MNKILTVTIMIILSKYILDYNFLQISIDFMLINVVQHGSYDAATMETVQKFPKTLKIQLAYDSATSLLHVNLHSWVYCSIIHNS